MPEVLRYVMAAAVLGVITYFGSEALFWVFPPAGATPAELAATVLAYALASACVVSALILTGAGGLAGLFLAGALLGFLIEGVIVNTMYDAFPFQLVWTPLAWHALITGLGVVVLPRVMAQRAAWQHALAMVALGAVGGLMAVYWPIERTDLPDTAAIFAYLLGFGTLAVVGHMALDRLATLPRPRVWVLWVMPALALVLWLIQSAADPRPQRLALPLMTGLTLWAMRGLQSPLSFGPATPPLRHALFLLAPLTAAIAATLARGAPPGFPATNCWRSRPCRWDWRFGSGRCGAACGAQLRSAPNAAPRSIAPSYNARPEIAPAITPVSRSAIRSAMLETPPDAITGIDTARAKASVAAIFGPPIAPSRSMSV